MEEFKKKSRRSEERSQDNVEQTSRDICGTLRLMSYSRSQRLLSSGPTGRDMELLPEEVDVAGPKTV